ncbi:MAG: putative selenate reductase subunit YgfK, partial [Spirochaetales bacterium]|nr:putative selenate reductase subunit YgfK [Spirochaetales bacterium]
MADIMRPLSLKELITRILGEYDRSQTIFGIPEDQFFRKQKGGSWQFMEENAETPLGPAAGPHTQLAQNIAAAFLSGARFIELKTVQIMDTLEIDKPCIDCRDECFNTEWSSEFTVPKAYDEYLKAWFLLHLLEELFDLRSGKERSFLFNMSVGYNLEGIKSPKIDSFIESLKNSSDHPLFLKYKDYINSITREDCPSRSSHIIEKWKTLTGLEERVSPKICSQLTLSTMHGCPPKEIEQIVSYMLTEKKLNTFVKLNPTLLGYDFVKGVIEKSGYEHIVLSRDSFDHDLSYKDAVPMLGRLKALAQKEGRLFGLKLTNTLGTLNRLDALPGEEMYMSGRLLYPLSLNVAARLSREFDGELPISFSGGLNRFNMEAVIRTGIGPVTAATDFLKPGGYLRMAELARFIDGLDYTQSKRVDVESLEKLAAASLGEENEYLEKRKRGYEPVSVPGPLPLYDCFVAPCKVACPIGQDIPEYIELTAQGRYEEAAALIYEKNPLPFITGHICAHQCQYKCTRRDYESPVEIREIKKIALEKGFEAYKEHLTLPERKNVPPTAVIGAGPAGLAAASYLARKGLPVTIIDENEKAGGVVEHNIPDFRIPREAIERDVQFIKDLGVDIRLGEKFAFDLDRLYAEGFETILLAVGADKIRPFPIEGDQSRLMASFKFINAFNRNRDGVQLGKHVVVVGGGDT